MSASLGFTKEEFDASVRALLVGFAEWVEQILTIGAIPRTIDSLQDPEQLERLFLPHAAGDVIEKSWFRWRMLNAYDFAATGIWDSASLEELMHESEAFEQLCGVALESHTGRELVPAVRKGLPPPQTMCLLVLEHAKARHSLRAGDSVTLAQLALLAGLKEKTVRMAANPQSTDPLLTEKDGHNTYVTAEEALRWLLARPNFMQTVMLDDTNVARPYSSIDALARHLKQLRQGSSYEIDNIFSTLDWDQPIQAAYQSIEQQPANCDPRAIAVRHWYELGRLFGIGDPREFARHAATVLAPRSIDLEIAGNLT